MALKRPNAISFSKKNTVRPFEDASSLEFWSAKNDASMFVVGQSTKKRPDGLTFVRMFDGKVLDMCEVGVDKFISMDEFKVRLRLHFFFTYTLILKISCAVFLQTKKSTPGHRPLMHFASELFDTHPRFIQLKSILLDFFGSEILEGIHMSGVEHVISVQLAPTPAGLNNASSVGLGLTDVLKDDDVKNLPKVHLRSYTIAVTTANRAPHVELTPMGPSFDLSLRRTQEADPEMWKQAMKRPKLKKQDVEKGLGKKKKNLEVDEMGDLRGRLHLGKQDLGKLQTRKMKGLKKTSANEVDDDDDGSEGEENEEEPTSKRRKA